MVAFTLLACVYMFVAFLSILLIIFAAHHIIAFEELKVDHVNPIDHCNVMNPLGEKSWFYEIIDKVIRYLPRYLTMLWLHCMT